jgi:hypothetical protein
LEIQTAAVRLREGLVAVRREMESDERLRKRETTAKHERQTQKVE